MTQKSCAVGMRNAILRIYLKTLVRLCGKFALRRGQEHRILAFAMLEVIERDEEERTRLRYTQSAFGEKNLEVV